MRGGSAGCRRSMTTTSTPRQARSKASVSPTGPAPTISTSVSISWFIISSSNALLSLEVHLANDAAVFFVLLANERTKIRAAHFYWIEADPGKLRPYVGDLHCCCEPACQLRDCFLRCFRGRE